MTTNTTKKIKEKDKVRRHDQKGPFGVVSALRYDSAGGNSDRHEKGVIIGVQWDNGTFSYLTPDALDVVE